MNISVKLTQYDRLEGTENVLCDGPGYLYKERLIYWEDAKHTVRHEVSFTEDGVTLKRFAEIRSETVLKKNGPGESRVVSPFGEFLLETHLDEYEQNDDFWMIAYRIVQEGETVTSQKLVWELRGIADE